MPANICENVLLKARYQAVRQENEQDLNKPDTAKFNNESEVKMDPDKSRALDLFSELLNEGEGINFGLEARSLQRGVVIKRKSETVFFISIERHPHLFGRPSLGKMSSAYATVTFPSIFVSL